MTVENLSEQGATVDVIRGSVSDEQDVKRMIETATKPVGGAIQGAIGLDIRKVQNDQI